MGLFNTSAQAELQDTIYTGIQLAQVTYEDDFTGVEAEPSALVLRIGGYLEGGTGIEARLGFGLDGYGDTLDVGGVDVDFDVENFFGLYGLYHIGWGSNASLYGLLGVTNGEIKISPNPAGFVTDRETSLSYGIGLNIARLNFEIVRYFHDNDFDVTAISFGYVSKF
jgi:hypothetical protein